MYHLVYRRRSLLERIKPEFVVFDLLDVRVGIWTWKHGLQIHLPFLVAGWEFGKPEFVPVGVTKVDETAVEGDELDGYL